MSLTKSCIGLKTAKFLTCFDRSAWSALQCIFFLAVRRSNVYELFIVSLLDVWTANSVHYIYCETFVRDIYVNHPIVRRWASLQVLGCLMGQEHNVCRYSVNKYERVIASNCNTKFHKYMQLTVNCCMPPKSSMTIIITREYTKHGKVEG